MDVPVIPVAKRREAARIAIAEPAARWLWLTAPIAVLMALVSATGYFEPNFYTGPLAWTIQGVAQDFADLFLVLPVLVVSALLAARGSRRAWLVWLGVLTYIVYTFVIYAFAVHYNRLFLAYVAVLGAALWALIGGMAATDWQDLEARFSAAAPVKLVGLYLIVPAVLFYLMWLAAEVPALLAGAVPKEVTDNGLLTNPVHVLDFTMMLPAMMLSGVLLWRRHMLGYGLAAIMMVNALFQDLAIASMMTLASRAGLPAGPVPLFITLAVITLALLYWYLRDLGDAPGQSQTGAAPAPRP